MRSSAKAFVIALAMLPGMARAAEPPCLSAGEFTALAGYALPSVIGGTVQRCAATLPADAFLQRNGSELAQRYAVNRGANWPQAKAVFLKLGGSGNAEAARAIRSLPDQTLQAMLDGLIEGMVGQNLPAERCTTVDRVIRLLSPLPPESTAELIALAAGLGAKSGKAKVGAFSLCAA
ncbi:MAG TPA: hypothetical protein PKE25_01270 [Novosphingobium sp.]|nr:hypothetical protein [Novosphingobium sp.]